MTKKLVASFLEIAIFVNVFLLLAFIAHYQFDISWNEVTGLLLASGTYLLTPRFHVLNYQSGNRIKANWFLSKFL